MVNTLSKGSGVMELLMSYNRVIDGVIFDFVFFKTVENSYKQEIEELGGSVTKFVDFKRKINNRIHFDNFMKPDLMHIHVTLYINYFYYTVGRKLNIPMIGHAHSTKLSNSLLKEIRNKLLIFNSATKYNFHWGCSEEAISEWFGTKSEKLSNSWVMPNAIECTEIKRAINRQNKANDRYTLGTVGRLSPEKNHEFLIEMVSELLPVYPNIYLKIIGDGELRSYLNKIIHDKKLNNNILLCGNLDKVKLYEEMCTFDLFVFPSFFEGFGTALIEAQAFSIPSISSTEVPISTDMGHVKYISTRKKDKWIEEIKNRMSKSTKIKFNDTITSHNLCIESACEILKCKYEAIIFGDLL